MVELIGIVAITKGDKSLIGIEIKVADADRIRKLVGCTSFIHIITTYHFQKVVHLTGTRSQHFGEWTL